MIVTVIILIGSWLWTWFHSFDTHDIFLNIPDMFLGTSDYLQITTLIYKQYLFS